MFLELQLDKFQVSVHFKHHLNTSISFHLSGPGHRDLTQTPLSTATTSILTHPSASPRHPI